MNAAVAFAVILSVSLLSIGKAELRLKAIELVLPQYFAELRRQFWTQNTLWLLSPPIFLYNCVTGAALTPHDVARH